jgi:hypothetical protein
MRRFLLLTGLLALALTGTALALSYRTGTYKAGGQSGFKRPGIRIDIHRGSFNVERILMHETCKASGHPTFHDFGGFQQGHGAVLKGKVTQRGNFSGIYRASDGSYAKVSGHISGSDLTVSGREATHYTPEGSTVTYSCHASGTFTPKRTS